MAKVTGDEEELWRSSKSSNNKTILHTERDCYQLSKVSDENVIDADPTCFVGYEICNSCAGLELRGTGGPSEIYQQLMENNG